MIRVSALRVWMRPETVEHTTAEWPATARSLAPPWADRCARNGATMPDSEWDRVLGDGDHVFYWTRPAGVFVAGISVLGFIVQTLAIGALGFLLSRLLAKKPVKPGDEESATYGFTNLQENSRAENQPIPVVYGKHRVAPPVINEYLRSGFDANGNPTSELLMLMLVSEGPIKSIGGKLVDGGPFDGTALSKTLEINNQPATNFEGIEMHVRLGSLEQTPIPGFAEPVLQFPVDQTLRDSETLTHTNTLPTTPSSTTAIATPGVFAVGNVNVDKWDKHVTYVSGDEADEFTVVLHFPTGLISFDSGGAELPNSLIYQVRYRRVDDVGTPFGDYIVLDAEQVTQKRKSPFSLEYRRQFFDETGTGPDTYAPPAAGSYLRTRSTLGALNNPGVSYPIDPTNIPQRIPADTKFSAAGWLKRRSNMTAGTTARIFQWFDVAGNEGFRLNVVYTSGFSAALQFQFGTGSAVVTLTTGQINMVGRLALSTFDTLFHHWAVTYEARFDGTNTRVRFYVDGGLVATMTSASQASWDMPQPIRLLSDSETTPTLGYDGHADETTFWSRVLSTYDVANLYRGGNPLSVAADADELVIGARFDTADTTGVDFTHAFGPGVNGAASPLGWKLGTGANAASDPDIFINAPTDTGIVKTPEGGKKIRAKFLVEVMRLNTEDTAVGQADEVSFDAIQLRRFESYEYPQMALLAVKILATDQVNGSRPLVTEVVEGRLPPVWDGVDPVYPNAPATYSRNPAWVAADVSTNQDYALGALYTLRDLDMAMFKSLADYCDEYVYDNGPRQVLVAARQIEAADSANLPTALQGGSQDYNRWQFAALPSNFQQVSSGVVISGKRTTLKVTGTPSPAIPAWLTTELNAGPQEIVLVQFIVNSFFMWSRTSTNIGATSANYTPTVSSTNFLEIEMYDVRYRYDGVFDRADVSAWDALVQVLQTARSVPVRLGSRLSLFVDRPGSPVALVGMGNIIEGSWKSSFQDIKDRANAEEAEFTDEEFNWERKAVADEHPTVTDPATQSAFKWRRIRVEGVTRRGQVKRGLRRDLNEFYLLRRMVEFELGLDALPFQPGDVISVAHDVPGYGYSGRVWETASVGTSVKFDRELVLETGHSYQVQIQNQASGVRETKPITTGVGTYPAGTALTIGSGGFSFIPDQDDLYSVGDVAIGETKDFRIVETSLDPKTMRVRVRAIEYNEDVYDDDFGTLPEVTSSYLPVPAAPTVPPGVQNLTVNEQTQRGPDGAVRITAAVSFSHVPETYSVVGSTSIFVSEEGVARESAMMVARLNASTTEHRIDNFHFERDRTYTIWVVPENRDGSAAYRSYASFQKFTPDGLARPPLPVTGLQAVISGEMVVFQWNDPGDLDQSRIVEGRQGGWKLALPLFAVPAAARATVPLTTWAGGPENEVGVEATDICVRTKIGTGQYSEDTLLTFQPTVVSSDGDALEISEEDNEWGTA